jgi:hypothetical protein
VSLSANQLAPDEGFRQGASFNQPSVVMTEVFTLTTPVSTILKEIFVTPQELINFLPQGLKNALELMMFERELGPDTGFQELRHVAQNVYLSATLNAGVLTVAESRLPVWLEEQENLQIEATKILEQLMENEPLDPANMPSWPWTDWAKSLRNPWSENLSKAVVQANLHLNSSTPSARVTTTAAD